MFAILCVIRSRRALAYHHRPLNIREVHQSINRGDGSASHYQKIRSLAFGQLPLDSVRCENVSVADPEVSTDGIPDNVYPTDPKNKNLLVIIEQFSGQKSGSEQDRKALDKLFREVLGFEVTVLQDLHKAAFKKELSDIVEGINRSVFQYDRLFVAILGHGNQDGVATCSSSTTHESIFPCWGLMPLQEIVTPFKTVNLPKMAGRPKVFLINSCRGYNHMDGLDVEENQQTGSREMSGDAVLAGSRGMSGDAGLTHTTAAPKTFSQVAEFLEGTTVAKEADVLICSATEKNYVAYSMPNGGSWFFQTLVHVLHEQYKKKDLLKMMTEVSGRVAKLDVDVVPVLGQSKDYVLLDCPVKQTPHRSSTLQKKIFLTRRRHHPDVSEVFSATTFGFQSDWI